MDIEKLKNLSIERTISILNEVGVKCRKRNFSNENVFLFQIFQFGILGVRCLINYENNVALSKNIEKAVMDLYEYDNVDISDYGVTFDYIIKEIDPETYIIEDYYKAYLYKDRSAIVKELPKDSFDNWLLSPPYYVYSNVKNEGVLDVNTIIEEAERQSNYKPKDYIIDCFAGGGGASVGIEMALGRSIDIAINHDPDAISMHKKNHPDTLHLTEDMLKVNIGLYLQWGDKVSLLWASPDCTSHSRAKGDKPIKRGLRILPMGVYRLCKQILKTTGNLPEVLLMENVPEIQDWGPLDANNKPIKERKGEYYQKFIKLMSNLGFRFESKNFVAADFGAHTTRNRWYAQFRSDDKPISWPEPTHNKGGTNGLKKWEAIADYINFTNLGNSIFGREKPLAENTMNRIAGGLDKFVFNSKEPFIIQVNHGGNEFRGQSVKEPIPTITGKNGYAAVTPYITQIGQTGFTKNRNRSVKKPISTVVTKNEHCLISPMMIQYHSESKKQSTRGQAVSEPVRTIDTNPRYALVSAFLTKFYKSGTGQSMFEPIHTITTSAGHFGQVSILAVDYKELIKSGVDDETAQKCTWVSQFIMEYYGCGTGQSLNDPLHTVVTKDRFALITVLGNEYAILDIFLRMLEPEELKMGQGFPKDYIIEFIMKNGKKYPKSKQVERIGNSVVPIMAELIVLSACPYLKVGERIPNLILDDTIKELKLA